MRINNTQEIRSSVIKISDIEDLAGKISKLCEKDNEKNDYKRSPDFEISQKNNFDFKFDNKDEYIEFIKSNIEEIKSIRMSYWGDKERISLACGDYKSSLNIDTQDKGKSLEYIEYVNKIFKEKSWNDIANKGWSYPILMIIIFLLAQVAFLIINKSFVKKEFFIVFFALYIFASVVTIPLNMSISKIYPNLVLKNGNEIYGRILKKDLWKIISGLILIIVSAWIGKIIFR